MSTASFCEVVILDMLERVRAAGEFLLLCVDGNGNWNLGVLSDNFFFHAPSILVLMVMMMVGLVMLSLLSACVLLANRYYLLLMVLMTLYCLMIVCFRAQAILIPSF